MSKPTALTLAALCDGITFHEEYEDELAKDAAAELRRLHELNMLLIDVLQNITDDYYDRFSASELSEYPGAAGAISEARAALAKAQGENNES